MGHPERFWNLANTVYVAVGFDPETDAKYQATGTATVGACRECHQPLKNGERRVHEGACARARKVHLQSARRRSRRRA